MQNIVYLIKHKHNLRFSPHTVDEHTNVCVNEQLGWSGEVGTELMWGWCLNYIICYLLYYLVASLSYSCQSWRPRRADVKKPGFRNVLVPHVECLISTRAPASIGEHLSLLKHVLYNMSKMHCNFSLELCSMWRKAEFFRLLSVSFLLPPQFNFNATVTAVEYGTGVPSQHPADEKRKK